jgi:RNA recognition motif-containing protein
MSAYSDSEQLVGSMPSDNGTTPTGVKLFVGQIPREMDEDTLIPYFAEFGPIVELTVIRDRATKLHKGCAFVSYLQIESAHQAIEQLHDKIKLGHAINPLQVRIAECQVERENKLFIGMLPKTATEEQLHDMFVKFGDLREVHIIRGPEGSSKGCAFVKFVERESALFAIEEMNNKVPEGSTRPLVIKFADVKKHGKKIDGNPDYLSESMANMNISNSKEAPYWLQQQVPQQQQVPTSPYYFPQYNYSHSGGIPLPQQIMQSYMPYSTHTVQNVSPYMVVDPSFGRSPVPQDMKQGYLSPQQQLQRGRDMNPDKKFSHRSPMSGVLERYQDSPLSPSSSSQRLDLEDSPPSPTRPPEGSQMRFLSNH